MSQLKPYSSFTSDSLAAYFPAAKILFHADDFTSGALTWVDRVTGLTMNFTAAVTKDSVGLYSTTGSNGVASVTGTMPTLADKYVVFLSIGSLQTASATAGLTIVAGTNGLANSLANTGAAVNATTFVELHTLSGSITAGSKACKAAYWDMVDTSSPLCAGVLASASNVAVDQAIPNAATNTTDNTGKLAMVGALTSAFSMQSINATTAGQRTKIIALFEFASALTPAQLQLASVEMARTQELFAGWRNVA